MTTTKKDYESPIIRVLELRFKSIVCASGQMGIQGWQDGEEFEQDF